MRIIVNILVLNSSQIMITTRGGRFFEIKTKFVYSVINKPAKALGCCESLQFRECQRKLKRARELAYIVLESTRECQRASETTRDYQRVLDSAVAQASARNLQILLESSMESLRVLQSTREHQRAPESTSKHQRALASATQHVLKLLQLFIASKRCCYRQIYRRTDGLIFALLELLSQLKR